MERMWLLKKISCEIQILNEKVWKLMIENGKLEKENRKLKEEVRFLEECLDRKEKLNEKYRKEIDKLKSTYVYDAKQVRDIC